MSREERRRRIKHLIIFEKPEEGGPIRTFCGICKVPTSQPYDHIENKHLQIEAYECQFCAKRFKSNSSLYKHISRNHNEESKIAKIMDLVSGD